MEQPLIITNTENYQEYYSNSVQMRGSLWDFTLLFGRTEVKPMPETGEAMMIHNFAGVFLSPPTAKALLKILIQRIDQYESMFGEIKAIMEPPGGQTAADTGFWKQ